MNYQLDICRSNGSRETIDCGNVFMDAYLKAKAFCLRIPDDWTGDNFVDPFTGNSYYLIRINDEGYQVDENGHEIDDTFDPIYEDIESEKASYDWIKCPKYDNRN